MMLLHSPELILLDEPTLGLDVVAKRQMIGFLKKINREQGVTILVTSHDMDDLEEMARRILMISRGKLAFDGSFDGLREITGNLTRFTVTTDGRRPELADCRLLGEKHGVFEFEVDMSRLPIQGLLTRLSQVDGILDVEITAARSMFETGEDGMQQEKMRKEDALPKVIFLDRVEELKRKLHLCRVERSRC